MRYQLTPSLNDGMRDAPPVTADVRDLDELMGWIAEEMANDEGRPFGPRFTLLIERME